MTLVALFAIRRGPREVEDVVRFSVDTPDGLRLDPDLQGQAQLLAISPDGRRIAFRANDGKERRIFVRDLSRDSAQPVSGTEGGTEPFFSPDGEWLGFVAEGKVKKTALRGGTPTTVASANLSRGASWGKDGTIVVSPSVNSPLFRVPAAGGELRPLTTLDTKARERTHRWPEILPDGDTVLFTVGTEDKPGDYDDSSIDAVSLKTGKRHLVYRGASFAKYAPPGHLLLARHGDVLAAPFDAGSAQVRGTVTPVLQGVSGDARSGVCYFGVARTGTVAYAVSLSPQGINDIVWMDRAGRPERTAIPAGNFSEIALSPDGQKLAFAEGPAGGGRSDIWIADLARGGQFQLTSTGRAASPRWAPDGKSVVFATPGGDSILRQPADGSSAAEVLWKSTLTVPINVNSFAMTHDDCSRKARLV
jgi:serine/threonine-protein kinase